MTERSRYIHSVIDKSIDYSSNCLRGLQEPDFLVPEEMVDRTKTPTFKDVVFWKPIPANLAKNQFEQYENVIGFKLPSSYKDFLSYRFFISLNFSHEANFFRHTATWIEDYYKEITDIGIEETLEMGLIPFAYETDRGCFCFDTSNVVGENEYKVVTYFPEFGGQEYPSLTGQFSFIDFVGELEQRLDSAR